MVRQNKQFEEVTLGSWWLEWFFTVVWLFPDKLINMSVKEKKIVNELTIKINGDLDNRAFTHHDEVTVFLWVWN